MAEDLNSFAKELVSFFKHAAHLWGRCPNCASVFRLSEAAISATKEPPRDWLRRLERREALILEREAQIEDRESDVSGRENDVGRRERDVEYAAELVEAVSKKRVQEILRSKTEIQSLIKESNKASVQRSRATLIGKLLERLAPCFANFGYDPRDMRCICDPFDYVLFNGLTVNRRVSDIQFIEVKGGVSRLNSAQRSLREAIDKNRVEWQVWNIGEMDIPITQQLASSSPRSIPVPAKVKSLAAKAGE